MSRVVVGTCPACSRSLKVAWSGVKKKIQHTCSCGARAEISLSEQRVEELRKEEEEILRLKCQARYFCTRCSFSFEIYATRTFLVRHPLDPELRCCQFRHSREHLIQCHGISPDAHLDRQEANVSGFCLSCRKHIDARVERDDPSKPWQLLVSTTLPKQAYGRLPSGFWQELDGPESPLLCSACGGKSVVWRWSRRVIDCPDCHIPLDVVGRWLP